MAIKKAHLMELPEGQLARKDDPDNADAAQAIAVARQLGLTRVEQSERATTKARQWLNTVAHTIHVRLQQAAHS